LSPVADRDHRPAAAAQGATAPGRILLIGFVSVDPRGPERLAALLRRERPRRIGIERSTDRETETEIEAISREAVGILLEKMVDAYSEGSRPAAREVARRVAASVGYDQREVERYVAGTAAGPAKAASGGGSATSPTEVIRIESTVERYNFARDVQRKARSIQGVREPHLKRPDFTLEAFQNHVDSNYYNERAVAMALASEGMVGRRQEIMAQKLLDTKCDCAVVGFAHIVDYRGTLYNRLKHLRPRRIALNASGE
jgi:hypothetical protein